MIPVGRTTGTYKEEPQLRTAMITASVIHRVFMIRLGESVGTGFTIDVEGRQYLVTANHVVKSLGNDDGIDIFSHGAWSSHEVQLVGHADELDISVLAVTTRLTPPNLAMEPTFAGLVYGQDTYFLGFPYGFTGRFVLGDSGYPLPFVKKATVSLLDGPTLILEGHNNPGFSGGPVVFTHPERNEYRVAAVISSYRYVEEPVYDGPQDTGLRYQYNTGLVIAHSIEPALDLIRANPIGYELT